MSDSEDSFAYKLNQKLESGEISQQEYDDLFQKFESLGLINNDPKVEQLQHLSNIINKGFKTISGGSASHVMSSGKLSIDSNLECQRLSITGSIEVDGELTVIGNSSINGELIVAGKTNFGGPVSSTGSITIEGDMYSTAKISSSGKLDVEGTITTDALLNLSGELFCVSIKSSAKVRLSGTAEISSDILAESFEISRGNISIGGGIRAKRIYVTDPFKQLKQHIDTGISKLEVIPDLARVATKIASNILPTVGSVLSTITDTMNPDFNHQIDIVGDVVGEEIVISNVHIHGDLIGDELTIGEGVKVDGKVKFKKSITVTTNEQLDIEKIE